jgi:hypothetical protein
MEDGIETRTPKDTLGRGEVDRTWSNKKIRQHEKVFRDRTDGKEQPKEAERTGREEL